MVSGNTVGGNVTRGQVAGPPIRSMQLGVYRVVTEILPLFNPRQQWKKAVPFFPTAARLVRDVYELSPWMLFFCVVTHIWCKSIAPSFSLYLSSRILAAIEDGLKRGSPDSAAIFQAVGLRMIFMVLTTAVDWWRARMQSKMKERLTSQFARYILRSKLETDLTGVQANVSSRHVSEASGWYTFKNLLDTVCNVAGVVAQLYLSSTMLSVGHAPIFTLLCLVRPILGAVFSKSLSSKPHLVQANDPHFLRMKSLRELGRPTYREDILTGDIVEHIIREFRRAVNLLGDADIRKPSVQYQASNGPASYILTKLASDLPMLYYAANTVYNSAGFNLTVIASLHQCESLLHWTFESIVDSVWIAAQQVNLAKAVYDLEHVVHKTESGDLPYPPLGRPHEQGMPVEMRNVSFSYPGSTSKALNNVTLSIKAGQLIVIVGANGSGKSTLVKLLTSLYDATSGSITVDGEDIRSYRLADRRRATAALTQGHRLFPLSLRENIGIGNPAHVADMGMIHTAAKQGGADGLVSKLGDGFETVLQQTWGTQFSENGVKTTDNTPLGEAFKKILQTTADVSGGERQRLAASRTFMRLTSSDVKLVCVDEPSANLDPEAELQLFNNLRMVRQGKTMVFVTHRFAHLTKHADLILCMKEGAILESGTHEELMALDGEYCKMFEIQAKAFTEFQDRKRQSSPKPSLVE
ncbi:P-loop containing nucleoside triphosphate hydrolase protein [Mycena metata]|uniref:P-loop containing nucleoside triphosphate hydrolase protein n=1 Tax=Mycena metata TaxID=1033252 RepID=A0AAD7JIP9_9AGAR|nr:P-loop containing nucleoside triphosphate hydrolase protein [Mycena metata]